jgi:hypothetical protein
MLKYLQSLFIFPLFLFSNNKDYVENEVFIRFHDSCFAGEKEKLIERFRLKEKRKFLLTKAILYTLPSGNDAAEVIPLLNERPCVKYADFNNCRAILHSFSEPGYSLQWSLNNTGQEVNGKTGKVNADINWAEAMQIYKPQNQIGVAVIDSGVAIDHPEISFRLGGKVLEQNGVIGVDDDENGYIDDTIGWDFVDWDNQPEDLSGHGTKVAGIISADPSNGEGITGIAPDSFIVPLRVFDEIGGATDEQIILAAGYGIMNGARILNLSLGKGKPFNYPMQEAIYDLENEYDTILICAAGNGGIDGVGDDIDRNPVYPAAYDGNAILSVAASNSKNELAPFSNYGISNVDLAAPGTNMYGPTVSRKQWYYEDFGYSSQWTTGRSLYDYSGMGWSFYTDIFGNRWATDSNDLYGNQINYFNNSDTFTISPNLNMIGVSSPRLFVRIYHRLAYDYWISSYDFLYIEYSINDGVTWKVIDAIYGYSGALGSVYNFDLGELEGENNVQFRFRLKSDSLWVDDGVYIDDFLINGVTSFNFTGNEYEYNDGTSFSAPVVSGVAAMVLSHRPELSVRDLREILLSSVTNVDELNGKVASGGVINAYEAIRLANSWVPTDFNSGFDFELNTAVSPSSGNPGTIYGSGSYRGGTEVTLRANANFGYTFSHWSGQIFGDDSTLTHTLIADTSVTANFTKSKDWSQAENLNAGWKTLSWIGYYWEDQGPWIFHSSLGWLYRYDQTNAASWLYSPTQGWLFSAGQNMPFLFSSTRSSWIYAGEKDLYKFTGSSWSMI